VDRRPSFGSRIQKDKGISGIGDGKHNDPGLLQEASHRLQKGYGLQNVFENLEGNHHVKSRLRKMLHKARQVPVKDIQPLPPPKLHRDWGNFHALNLPPPGSGHPQKSAGPTAHIQ
jgi:hypothetical protein